jgi:Xaa-Pro aminopeptidase
MLALLCRLFFFLGLIVAALSPASTNEARARWEMRNQIRRDKFDLVLPQAMRQNAIDMWITVMKEGNFDPLYLELGGGYVSSIGFIVFADVGKARLERAVLGIDGQEIENCGAYDIFGPASDLKKFVTEREPKRIGVNMSDRLGRADGLSRAGYDYLVKTLGPPYDTRLVSADKLISDFLYHRVASEIAIFAEAGRISRELAEQALSNEIIVPGKTMLEDVAWWLQDQLEERRLESSFGLPSIYITGPEGIEAISNRRIIRRGDLLMIDWGVGLIGFYTDMKRIAYVLKDGETEVPGGIQNAFDQAVKAREVVRHAIEPGRTGSATAAAINAALEAAGFAVMKEFNRPSNTEKTEVITGCHSVGDWGHGIGPSAAFFQTAQLEFEVHPTTLLSIEFFAYTAAPEWGGKKVRIPLEDDGIVTERGVEWLYPANNRILLVR